MDSEFESPHPPRKQLAQRFRATTDQPREYRAIPTGRNNFNHIIQHSEHGLQVTPRRQPPSDLESSTRTLKNLLSIKSTSQPATTDSHPSFPTLDGPPSPSPMHHTRTRSAAQPPIRNNTPNHSKIQVPRRVVSTSGVPTTNQPTRVQPIVPTEEDVSEDDQTLKMEMELRKVLNLS
jgi:hypothetical protein